ncbi:MAG: AAA family ATPase [Bacteroidaceae bacterium]|nr:AAA family ATPase [Bacteroidaceae bacterium]
MIEESITSLSGSLSEAKDLLPDIRSAYEVVNHVFMRSLDVSTRQVEMRLVGPFAKTDYLLKEHHAGPRLFRAVNDTRSRLRFRVSLSDDELSAHFIHDCQVIAGFLDLINPDKAAPDEDLYEATGTAHNSPDALLQNNTRDYLRMRVSAWDDNYISGTTADGPDPSGTKVCYTGLKYDWTYLRPLLQTGTQLNLIRPHREGDIIIPEMIIFEPDYLIDISSIARCFENYAESPVVSLLHRLETTPASSAILMGELASQMLDEEVSGTATTYPGSVRRFFREHALDILDAGISEGFHEEAARQRDNIRRAVTDTLPKAVGSFRRELGMVEPSFFCEMLGLQGRMDYLQSDISVLIEQKAGKAAFVPNDPEPDTPKFKEQHYVQMLLYMLLLKYNFREQYTDGRTLSSFLLYSRYPNSLVGLGSAPELTHRALKVRNCMAWMELHLSQPGSYRLLERLTTDSINRKQVHNRLWTSWQAPHIAALLAPIHEATPLERAYYFRFLTFISNEHVRTKLGNRTKENSGFAATWLESLEDKRQAGNIYDSMLLRLPEDSRRVDTVVLEFDTYTDSGQPPTANFRNGDIVIIYPYTRGREPDVRQTLVFRCSIQEITAGRIVLHLRHSQTDSRVFPCGDDVRWAIEHDFYESSYSGLYQAMHAFLSAPRERRDLLLMQRQPLTDTGIQLKGDHGVFNEMALRVKQARDLFLIIGPPGTGKTSFGMLTTVREELLETGTSVLLIAYTNRAVDEMCAKLSEADIPFLRIGNPLSCGEAYRSSLLEEKVGECSDAAALTSLITSQRVVVGTCTSLSSRLSLLTLHPFSLAVIDEASQILEPQLLGLLSAKTAGGQPAISRIVMIGDHKQLPAVVQQPPEVSRVGEEELRAIGLTDCRLSLFERLMKRYADDPSVTYMLTRQGRMHHDIADFPSRKFYNSRLREVPLPHQIADIPQPENCSQKPTTYQLTKRFNFIPSTPPPPSSSDKVNPVEAEIISDIVSAILQSESDPETIGIIVPYRAQISAIRTALDNRHIPDYESITIDTVERFQGSQRKYIIYGFTVRHPYQLNFLTDGTFEDIDGSIIDRRLNVVMTRAREFLFLVGNPQILRLSPLFSSLIDFAYNP